MLTQGAVTAKLSSGREGVGGWLQFPSVSCSSYPQEVHKEVADPGRRYSRVNNPADFMTSSYPGVPRLGLQEITALRWATARAVCCVLSWHFTTPFLSTISYALKDMLPLITFLVKVEKQVTNDLLQIIDHLICFNPHPPFTSRALSLLMFIALTQQTASPWALLLHQSPAHQSHVRQWRAQADWPSHARCGLQTTDQLPLTEL